MHVSGPQLVGETSCYASDCQSAPPDVHSASRAEAHLGPAVRFRRRYAGRDDCDIVAKVPAIQLNETHDHTCTETVATIAVWQSAPQALDEVAKPDLHAAHMAEGAGLYKDGYPAHACTRGRRWVRRLLLSGRQLPDTHPEWLHLLWLQMEPGGAAACCGACPSAQQACSADSASRITCRVTVAKHLWLCALLAGSPCQRATEPGTHQGECP